MEADGILLSNSTGPIGLTFLYFVEHKLTTTSTLSYTELRFHSLVGLKLNFFQDSPAIYLTSPSLYRKMEAVIKWNSSFFANPTFSTHVTKESFPNVVRYNILEFGGLNLITI